MQGFWLKKRVKQINVIFWVLIFSTGCTRLWENKPNFILSIYHYLDFYPDKDVPNTDLPLVLRERKKAVSLLPPILKVISKEHKELLVTKIIVNNSVETEYYCQPTYDPANPCKKIKVLPKKMDYDDVLQVSLIGCKERINSIVIESNAGRWEYSLPQN
ncbi:hypothetical protein A7K93_01600 [Candidatus Methylacidiphilum fumarolicum]|uniref:Lipoprotein n=2 Tax=Candidatus Methylacidiphilum fumarolicum TaxID=591154 RepID=I0JVU1_METFB|nr:hypothetical protein [Candidatus Methylacidiphilum fumarolicum]MBW6414108.1 hypothetical protein [Candidatus Methylacidiphilum fumarolicum]TFE66456.1 hypothetical protein A7K73_01730 [Candidatus Methylacidiphilum fumarolicum]TFE75207.1 hypothetical protein A7K93_01600 [Candidatus Methylacidiphilum fumarolicum]TFE76182.1 hypothetical protein A7K72_00575 [Candidatus Methylacidiphilum fumarolicum]TFE77329.1 hypothetical protein A7D33_05845 [Candidatus Methylacidiphilum fumarolicum]